MPHAKVTLIDELEDRLESAVQRSDVRVLDELLGDDLVFTNHEGQVLSKQQDLAAHRSGLLKFEQFASLDRTVRHFDGCAVVTARVQLAGSHAGNAFERVFRFTRVWALRDSRWQLVAAHSTAASP